MLHDWQTSGYDNFMVCCLLHYSSMQRTVRERARNPKKENRWESDLVPGQISVNLNKGHPLKKMATASMDTRYYHDWEFMIKAGNLNRDGFTKKSFWFSRETLGTVQEAFKKLRAIEVVIKLPLEVIDCLEHFFFKEVVQDKSDPLFGTYNWTLFSRIGTARDTTLPQ